MYVYKTKSKKGDIDFVARYHTRRHSSSFHTLSHGFFRPRLFFRLFFTGRGRSLDLSGEKGTS
jgi:hypothetical protein